MDFFVWNEKFCVHHEAIDHQHKTLIEIINNLNEVVRANVEETKMRRLIAELEDYAGYHFSEEERVLEDYHSPDLDSQRKQHGFFTNEIDKMKNSFLQGETTIPQSLLSFMKDWLTMHILDRDKRIGQLLGKGLN